MVYIDNAATSFPKPESVYDSVLDCMKRYCANPGRGSHKLSLECEMKILDTRQSISELFNIDNMMNLIFTNNTTEGLNMAIKGVLKSGDHVITTSIEHNSVYRPLRKLTEIGVEVSIVSVDEKGYVNLQELQKNIKTNSKALIINHGSNVLGTVQDIEEIGSIAKKNNLVFIVDVAQTAGVFNIDVKKMNIDIMAFPGHKCLYGPQGIGGLYVSESIKIDTFKEGGTGSNSNIMEQPDFMPDKFESGTLNTPGIVGLGAGVNFITSVGLNEIRRHDQELALYLTSELQKLPYIIMYGEDDCEKKCPVVSFNIDGYDSSEVGEFLNNKDIYLRTGYHCAPIIHNIIGTKNLGTVRASFAYFNTIEDVEKLLSAVKELYGQNSI
ncbi:aminotransferase class V-fold PLP-dependent enzyme [Clostridium folliculivorans]|uniref:cysteine desulfurase n=1 Tax=Clostridium folliculivorans TaxID=2886038 RepID=A0A9W5XZ18_9CLOT|nr:aminotransferase class V-fold PLP-dependent enzyme [Clostridium folliculivorans]GKU23524.1 cysteine desulfurase [Clostridium folliculivorans]GKU29640.1 cysteine desulfurase [Clostridium folliculivorans]